MINFPIFDISLSDKKAQHMNSQPKFNHFFNAFFSQKKNQLNDFLKEIKQIDWTDKHLAL